MKKEVIKYKKLVEEIKDDIAEDQKLLDHPTFYHLTAPEQKERKRSYKEKTLQKNSIQDILNFSFISLMKMNL